MTLRDVLESKPSVVHTVSQDTRISEAVKLMVGKNIGAVLVVDEDDQLVGIFTERDVVHLTAKGVAFGNRPISSAMSRDLITFKASVDVSAAMSVISDHKKRHLPVVEDDKIAGIITYRDLVSYLLPEVVYMAREIY